MLAEEIKLRVLSEKSIVLEVGDSIDLESHQKVVALQQHLYQAALPALIELVPAYTTLTIYFDPLQLAKSAGISVGVLAYFQKLVRSALTSFVFTEAVHEDAPVIKIPVCYAEDFAPDLDRVARLNGRTTTEVIDWHVRPVYHVFQVGFAPGFPYLGVLPNEIATPRLEQPRLKVPAGAVAIGGQQTGIYTKEGPGGWNIIGRTHLQLFDAGWEIPCLLKAGDLVQFYAISKKDFDFNNTISSIAAT